jgi:hypothetical protein
MEILAGLALNPPTWRALREMLRSRARPYVEKCVRAEGNALYRAQGAAQGIRSLEYDFEDISRYMMKEVKDE